MLIRTAPTILSAYRNAVEELAYNPLDGVKPLKWGVCVGFPEPVTFVIEDALLDEDLHLGMASYTKSRWTRFLRRYFRADLEEWVHAAVKKLQRYPSRPFVASYALNLDTGHNYGGCLSSLQIRICPSPKVILYSRACHLDKVGFLDLSLIHLVAKAMGYTNVSAEWTVSLPFISAISQIYYLKRFDRPMEGHRLARSMKRLVDVDYDDIKFGPLKRGRKRMMELEEHGEIRRGVFVRNLNLGTGKLEEEPGFEPEPDEEDMAWFESLGDIA